MATQTDGPYEEAGERARDEAKIAASKAVDANARAASADAVRKIESLTARKTENPGDRSIA